MHRVPSMILGAIAGLALLASAAAAQPMRMSPEERTDQMAGSLALTAEQKARVLEIFKAADEARKKVAEEHQGDREAMREAMQQTRKETEGKLKEVLTEEQYAKWETMRAAMPGRGGPGRPGGRRGR